MRRHADTDRAVTSTVGTVFMVAVAVFIAATAMVPLMQVAQDLARPAPVVSIDAEFETRGDLDPHWVFAITHAAGDTIDGGDVRIHLVDNFGNEASLAYPGSFESGKTVRIGLWGSPSRAGIAGVDCEVDPETAPGVSNDQLLAASPPTSSVHVAVVHDPTNAVLDRDRVDLGDVPGGFPGGTRLVDGSTPSANCNDVRWKSGTVVPA